MSASRPVPVIYAELQQAKAAVDDLASAVAGAEQAAIELRTLAETLSLSSASARARITALRLELRQALGEDLDTAPAFVLGRMTDADKDRRMPACRARAKGTAARAVGSRDAG